MAVRDFYEEVAEKFIEKLKEGTAPWQRNWDAGPGMMPLNPMTENRYRGINVLILMAQNHDDSRWMMKRRLSTMSRSEQYNLAPAKGGVPQTTRGRSGV